MSTDLFGNESAEQYREGDLFENHPRGLRLALADLRERMQGTRRNARLRPDDPRLQARAAQAERDYLQLRDYLRRMSADELRADRVAVGVLEELPQDNAELFE